MHTGTYCDECIFKAEEFDMPDLVTIKYQKDRYKCIQTHTHAHKSTKLCVHLPIFCIRKLFISSYHFYRYIFTVEATGSVKPENIVLGAWTRGIGMNIPIGLRPPGQAWAHGPIGPWFHGPIEP